MSEGKTHPMDTGAVPIVGNFNMTQQMPNGRTMQIAGYLYEGESVESVNARIDMLQDVMERQRKRLEIPELQIKLDQLQDGMANQMDAYNGLLAKAEGNGKKLSSAEQTHIKNYPITIKRLHEEIEKGKKAIEDARTAGGL